MMIPLYFFARPPHVPALDFLKIFYYNKFVKKIKKNA